MNVGPSASALSSSSSPPYSAGAGDWRSRHESGGGCGPKAQDPEPPAKANARVERVLMIMGFAAPGEAWRPLIHSMLLASEDQRHQNELFAGARPTLTSLFEPQPQRLVRV